MAPTSVLTNGTAITEGVADALAALAARSTYSLEIRVSLDDVDPERNDRVRGWGSWAKAVRAIERLDARGLLPIVSVTEILADDQPEDPGLYRRVRDFLRSIRVEKPRVKILPVFPVGRLEGCSTALLTEELLEGFDRTGLQCAEARVITDDGVYACPILAGLPRARLSRGPLEESFRSAPLFHPACVTCSETGMSCRNF